MRPIRSDQNAVVFLLDARERSVLEEILVLYPCIPPAHARQKIQGVSKTEAETQDEALAEQRARNRRQLLAWLKALPTFHPTAQGVELRLRHPDTEWLLQVLNDVRVGSWIALGEPEELPDALPADPTKAKHACAMELAGLFQMALLGVAGELPGGAG